MTQVNIAAFDAKGRIATLHSMSVPYLQQFYYDKMIPWLREFTLPDGYKPFDETIPQKLAKYAESKGYTLAASPEDIWGPGWWKYDLDEAAKLLEKHGFLQRRIFSLNSLYARTHIYVLRRRKKKLTLLMIVYKGN